MVFYCCAEHQKADWKAAHKSACVTLQQACADEQARQILTFLIEFNVDNTPWDEFEQGRSGSSFHYMYCASAAVPTLVPPIAPAVHPPVNRRSTHSLGICSTTNY